MCVCVCYIECCSIVDELLVAFSWHVNILIVATLPTCHCCHTEVELLLLSRWCGQGMWLGPFNSTIHPLTFFLSFLFFSLLLCFTLSPSHSPQYFFPLSLILLTLPLPLSLSISLFSSLSLSLPLLCPL